MVSKEILQQAKYVHRDDDQYIEGLGQCGLDPCDHSKIIEDASGVSYRYCLKFQMPVDEYDSCQYHSALKMQALLKSYAGLIAQENAIKERNLNAKKKKKKSALPFLLFLCVCAVVIFMVFK